MGVFCLQVVEITVITAIQGTDEVPGMMSMYLCGLPHLVLTTSL